MGDLEWDEFDSTIHRGTTDVVEIFAMIRGWRQILHIMAAGDKWEVYIPAELGYDNTGYGTKVKRGDVLIFRIELQAIKNDAMPFSPEGRCNPVTLTGCDKYQKRLVQRWKQEEPLVSQKNHSNA